MLIKHSCSRGLVSSGEKNMNKNEIVEHLGNIEFAHRRAKEITTELSKEHGYTYKVKKVEYAETFTDVDIAIYSKEKNIGGYVINQILKEGFEVVAVWDTEDDEGNEHLKMLFTKSFHMKGEEF